MWSVQALSFPLLQDNQALGLPAGGFDMEGEVS
jgi:hypothetical protein